MIPARGKMRLYSGGSGKEPVTQGHIYLGCLCNTFCLSAFEGWPRGWPLGHLDGRDACRHCLLGDKADIVCSVAQQTLSAVSHSRHVCCGTQQTCLPCDPADMSGVTHRRHVCWVAEQTCLLCHTAGMSSVSRRKHVKQLCPTQK